ncbi:TPA: hypothetical protein JD254_12610 [Proteus mirabilis]|nr:hypothetical protein [Proteus mirabilis]HAU5580570.1 hypothetical protein [Proteus mirabilis]HAU5584409.1 hypothetical protein [Proteus mirabilis]
MTDKKIELIEKSKKENIINFFSNTTTSILSAIPYVSQVKTILDEYKSYTEEQEALILTKFFLGIGTDSSEKVNNMIESLGPEYAEKIIKNIITDSESRKVKYYGNIVVNICKNKDMNIIEREEIAIILKNISMADIDLAKKYYLYNSFDIDGFVDRNEQLSSLIDVNDGIQLKSINSLLFNGLVKESTVLEVGGYEPTKLLNKFINLIHLENEIVPENLNIKEKERVDIIFGIERFIFNRGKMMSAYNGKINDLIFSVCTNLNNYGVTYKIINDQDYNFVKCNVSAKFLIKIYIDDDFNHCYIYSCKDSDDFLSRDDKRMAYDGWITLHYTDTGVSESTIEEIASYLFELVVS